jgi:hypothetical protein
VAALERFTRLNLERVEPERQLSGELGELGAGPESGLSLIESGLSLIESGLSLIESGLRIR